MFTFIKYLPKILLGFKDVSEKYKEETGNNRPVYLSRTFIFSLLCFIGTGVTVVTGMVIDPNLLQILADNLPAFISAIIAIVGAIGSFVAQWKRNQTSSDTSTKQ